jgi:hypothetical protein
VEIPPERWYIEKRQSNPMSKKDRRNPRGLGTSCSTCAVAVSLMLTLLGCPAVNKEGPSDDQAFVLGIGKQAELGVDYRTGKITAGPTSPRVTVSFSTKDGKEAITIDCSRLGGGSIRGQYMAYLRGAKVERGEFDCLYQHTRDVVLHKTADSVRITGLRFTKVIE